MIRTSSVVHHPIRHLFLPLPPNPQSSELNLRSKEQECISLLKKCNTMEELKQIHGKILQLGLLWESSFCASNLLVSYALSDWGSMLYANSIFREIDDEDVGSFEFNTMIRGYVKALNFVDAIDLFVDMLERGIIPDNFTYPFTLKACAGLSLLDEGMQIHGHVFKLGYQYDAFVQSSLINMYGKCGRVRDSCAVFEHIEQKSVASWSALISAHANVGLWCECLELFQEMIREGCWRSEESILVSVLSACTNLGALNFGRCTHGYLLRNITSLNVIVQTSLMDMYVKCGSIEKAMCVFQKMSRKNKLSYSVLISGLGTHGFGHEALLLFSEMPKEGLFKPDDVLYLGVLSACRYAGLVEEGLQFFQDMKHRYGIQPTIQHYGCMVDLLGRAGMLEEALRLIKTMPMKPNDVIWRSLLTASRFHRRLEVGQLAARNLMQLGSDCAGDYVMLSNIYAQAHMWNDVAVARTTMFSKGLIQVPGFCSVEVNRKVYRFVSQDRSHRKYEDIYDMIYQIEWQLKFEGYSPDTSEVVLNVDGEEEKRQRLKHHNQKLALAFALLHTSKDAPIRVVRNVRMCSDCHTYTKLVSRIYSRKIIVRDRNQFHHFTDGVCSCKDYW